MAKSKLVEANQKIAEGAVNGYKKIEEGVVGGYKKIEEGAVGGFRKITDKFVDNFLTKEGESVEEAKIRLAAEQKAREAKSAEELRNFESAEIRYAYRTDKKIIGKNTEKNILSAAGFYRS